MPFEPYIAEDLEDITFKVLLQGKPKTFKTGACATAPDPWFADCDNGIATARNVNPQVRYGSKGWPCYRDTTAEAVRKGLAFDQLVKDLEQVVKEPSIKTIVIDSATFLYDIAMNKAQAISGKGGQPIPTQQDWLLQMRLCREIFQKLTALPDKNVIITAHVEMKEDQVTGRTMIMPHLTGKDSTKAPAFFDCFFSSIMVRNPETKKMVPKIKTVADLNQDLGCRFGGLEDEEEPNFTKIFNKMREYEFKRRKEIKENK